MSAREESIAALIKRFDALRDSGICSPTTRSLLDDAQTLLVEPRRAVAKYPQVSRVTVVLNDGIAFERYNAYQDGVELHLQDEGRTLKVFPLIADRSVTE